MQRGATIPAIYLLVCLNLSIVHLPTCFRRFHLYCFFIRIHIDIPVFCFELRREETIMVTPQNCRTQTSGSLPLDGACVRRSAMLCPDLGLVVLTRRSILRLCGTFTTQHERACRTKLSLGCFAILTFFTCRSRKSNAIVIGQPSFDGHGSKSRMRKTKTFLTALEIFFG